MVVRAPICAVFSATTAVVVNLSTLAANNAGGFSPAMTVNRISANEAGYVVVDFTGGFYMFGPSGGLSEDGGGNGGIVLNTANAAILD